MDDHGQDPGAASPHPVASAEHWDEHYSAEPVWSGRPNATLATEVADLSPGRALDVGCGEGADSVWLAQQGWAVTALDISPRAVALTTAAAARAGVSVEGMPSALLDADLAAGSCDLVSAMYPVIEKTPGQVGERRLLDLVAPGGTVLFVHHEIDPAEVSRHGFDPTRFVAPDDLAEVIRALPEEWELVTHERRERQVEGGAGAHHHTDIVVRARRR